MEEYHNVWLSRFAIVGGAVILFAFLFFLRGWV